MVIHPPIQVSEYNRSNLDVLMEKVRKIIASDLPASLV
jgi:hypothetical protein